MVEIVLGGCLIFAAGLGLLLYTGYGITRLLLPDRQQPFALLWAPFLGYAILAIVFHFLNVYFVSVRQSLIAVIALATLANLLAFTRRRAKYGTSWRSTMSLAAAVLLVYWVGLTPLFTIGHLTAVGKNWDVIDIYDATASYVIDYPVTSISASAPPNPLVGKILSRSALSNGWGFSYFQAATSILSQRSAIETQAPSMSLMHALLAPAAFLFLLEVFRFPRWLALSASLLLGIHPALLWILFQGFGNQAAMIGLLPLVLMTSFSAINKPSARNATLAALMLATIPLTYWVAWAFYLPAIAIYLAWRLLNGGGTKLATLIIMPAVLFGSMVLAPEGYLRMPPLVRALGGRLSPIHRIPGVTTNRLHVFDATDLNHFVDRSFISGLSYWVWPAPTYPSFLAKPPVVSLLTSLEQVLWLLSLAAALYGCWRLWRTCPGALLGLGITAVAALAVLQQGRGFYSYVKSFAFIAWWYQPLALFGFLAWWAALRRKRVARATVGRAACTACGVIAAALLVFNSALTEWFYTVQQQSQLTGTILPESSLRLADMVKLIPDQASVFIDTRPPLDPGVVSALAFFLRQHPLYGRVRTAESELVNPPASGQIIGYAILARPDDPADRGYPEARLLWANADIALYQTS